MANYLKRRDGRYYYRRRYPAAVAEILGRSEFVRALNTSDPKDASRLAHRVSVEFDDICVSAKADVAQPSNDSNLADNEIQPDKNVAIAQKVIDAMDDVMRTITASILARVEENPGSLKEEIRWRKLVLKAELKGKGSWPAEIAAHPLHIQAALKAIKKLEAGKPVDLSAIGPKRPLKPLQTGGAPSASMVEQGTLTAENLAVAFMEYKHGKTSRRIQVAQRCIDRCISLPCDMAAAVLSISNWCNAELKRGKKPAAVWTEVSAVIALLKLVPGWADFKIPKTGELRLLRGASKPNKRAKDSMPVPVLRDVMQRITAHLPKRGEHWQAALLLCSLYGFRPGELLQSGDESLAQAEDVMGNTRLVFRVGLNGAKNDASKRNLPVSEHLEPIFRLALRMASCISETSRTRVDRLNQLVRKTLGTSHPEISLYSIRHTFADVARACDFSDDQFGPLMGHSSKSGITGVYGGKEPLDKMAEILAAVEKKLYPEGIAKYVSFSV